MPVIVLIMGNPLKSSQNILVTGAFGFFGRSLLSALLDNQQHRIVAVDVKPIKRFSNSKTDLKHLLAHYPHLSHYHLDLTHPNTPDELAKIIEQEEIDTVVHLAFLSLPDHRYDYVHELETVGTHYVLEACELKNVQNLIMLSSTMCYGAHAKNPLYIKESFSSAAIRHNNWLSHRIQADTEAARFIEQHPNTATMLIRMAPGIGAPPFENIWSKYFSLPLIPNVLGYDPLIQFIHTDDATRFVKHAVLNPTAGVFNCAPPGGARPLSTWINTLQKKRLSVPQSFLRQGSEALWRFQLSSIPPRFEQYLMWPFCVSTEKSDACFDFQFRWSTELLLKAFPALLASHEGRPI